MTVSSTTTKNSYSGDGSNTVFAYTFKVFDEDDLTVILRTDATGTETVQTITTNYTVSGVGDAGGGNVTFVTAPASGVTVVIRRAAPLTQTTDYTPNDPFPASEHENALDKLTFFAQQQQEELDRAIKLSRTNTMTSTEFTVGSTDRANKILGFDGTGELSVTQELGVFRGDWTADTAFAVRDLIKDTSNDNIYICQTAHTSSGSLPISTNTDASAWELIVDAATATTSATSAAASATAAASSATAASASETAAAASETAAATSESNAASSATSASSSASTASTSATNAATSETNAATSATSAASSATSAASSATTATTKAAEASTSASNAATSETNAATSASSASSSATAAASSATSSASSATSAAASAAAAEAAADNFDDVYLGSKASAPTVDNDGDALSAGDLYFNTTDNSLYVYDGSSWNTVSPDLLGDITPQLGGNLDTNGNDINFGDNDKAVFGAGSDLQVYHDGTTASYIETPNVSHSLRLKSDSQLFQTRSGTTWLSGGSGSTVISGGGATTLSVTGTGADLVGDLNFGDNDKAIFGAGSDLQIYHNGTQSIIEDVGTGPLRIRSNSISIENELGTETISALTQDGAVTIYYDGSPKLATTSSGIDVTGTVTADGLTVDGNATINDAFPYILLNESDTTDLNTRLSVGAGYFNLNTLDDAYTVAKQRFRLDNSTGDISFFDSSGVSQSFYWDASTQRLGLGTTSPAVNLESYVEATGAIPTDETIGVTTGNSNVLIGAHNGDNSATFSGIALETRTSGASRWLIANEWKSTFLGDLVFRYRDGGSSSAEAMRITSAGVGIGTATPTEDLHIKGKDGAHADVIIQAYTGYNSGLNFNDNAGMAGRIYYNHSSNFMAFDTNGSERARVDASGNFLLGKTSANNDVAGAQILSTGKGEFTVSSGEPLLLNRLSTDGNIAVFRKDGTAVGSIGTDTTYGEFYISGAGNRGGLGFYDIVSSGIQPVNSDGSLSDGDTNLGYTSSRFKDLYLSGYAYASGFAGQSDGNTYVNFPGSDVMQFYTGGGERARVDASGNLLVGKSTNGIANIGNEFAASGYAYHTRSGGITLYCNRLTSDGGIAQFRKAGVSIGEIGVDGGDNLYLTGQSGNTGGIYMNDAAVSPAYQGAERDNYYDLGKSPARWQDVYATNGTIQTSDVNEKQDIEALSDAEQRVAVAAKGLLRKYRWKSSVEEKGDDARIHFGIIAQDLQAAFEAEGLDAGRYAMFINSEWTDEETGEQKSRMGIRYNQLLAFIIAAI